MIISDRELIQLNQHQLPANYQPHTIVYQMDGVEVYRLENVGTLQEKEFDFELESHETIKLLEVFWDEQLVFLIKNGIVLVNRLRLSHNKMKL